MDWNNWYEELENQGRGVSREMDYTLRNSLNPVGRASMEMRGDERAKASGYPSLISRFMSNDPTYQGLLQKEEDEKEVQRWMDFVQSENQKDRIYGQMDREGAFERGVDGWRLGMIQAKELTDMKNTQEKEMEAMRSVQNAAARPWSYMLEKSRQNMDTLGRLYGGYLS
jgi:hypothetical protein